MRDTKRQQQSFWGFLSGQHVDALGQRVILPRIFMNCGIQPWFNKVWNLDRILVRGNDIWLLEIKHKFPMKGKPLLFGLNEGELSIIVLLAQAGIRCLHTLVIKPVWLPSAGAMYLFNDMRMRARAAVIGIDLDDQITRVMLGGSRRSSPSHTTYSGKGEVGFYTLRASAFSRLGVLSDPAQELASSFAKAVSGALLPPVEDQWLLGLKASPDMPAAGN